MKSKADRQLAKMVPLKDFIAKFDGPFWDEVTKLLKAKLSTLRWTRSVARLPQLSEATVKMILAQEEAIEAIISLPDEQRAVLKMMEDEYRKTVGQTGDEESLDKTKL